MIRLFGVITFLALFVFYGVIIMLRQNTKRHEVTKLGWQCKFFYDLLFVPDSEECSYEQYDRLSKYTNNTEFVLDLWNRVDRMRESMLFKDRVHSGNFEPADNLFIFAKNLPDDAPDSVIAVASRNVSPALLRLSLSQEQLDDHLPFQEDPVEFLKDYAVVIQKNGMISHLRRKDKQTCHQTYRALFKNAFTVTNLPGRTVSYLTAIGEFFPGCAVDAPPQKSDPP